jgi:NitT/TauT family transport system substrate-binding protein
MTRASARHAGVRAAAGLAVLALLAAGCAAGTEPTGDDPTDGNGTEVVTLRVGDILGIPSAFLQFVVDLGFFEQQGLDVQVQANPGGAANIPGVVAGDFEIAGSNVVSMLLANSQGVPVTMISAGTFGAEDPATDFSQVLVTADSPVQGPEDLDGRSVAVNTLANIAEVTIRGSLDNAGAGHENIDFVEMGFPDMIPALQDGQVDAVHVIEPFLSIGLAQGLRPVIAPYAGTQPGMAIGSYFSSDQFIAENPDVIDRFIAGVSAGGQYIARYPDEFREALVDLANLDPEVAGVVNLPRWGGPVDVPSVELIGDLMVDYGLITEVPAMEDVVYQR